MIDYNQLLEVLQREIAERFREYPETLNVPGRSMACRISQFHYLAPFTGLCEQLAQWTGMEPETVRDTIVKTGNVLMGDGNSAPSLAVELVWGPHGAPIHARVDVAFLHSDFIDRSLALYGGLSSPLPVSELRIRAEERTRVEEFTRDKAVIPGMCFR